MRGKVGDAGRAMNVKLPVGVRGVATKKEPAGNGGLSNIYD